MANSIPFWQLRQMFTSLSSVMPNDVSVGNTEKNTLEGEKKKKLGKHCYRGPFFHKASFGLLLLSATQTD